MKNLKKLASILLALILALSTTIVFAEATVDSDDVGSITINGVTADAVYEVYKLLDLESYNVTDGAYSYKVNSAWTGFFNSEEAKAYVTIDPNGYVTWTGSEAEGDVAAFAKSALAYAEKNNIAPLQSSKDGEFVITENAGKFSDLPLGYYLIDSNMGALCGLTTTNPDASINAKNGKPTVEKQVQEDSTNLWGTTNTADIGQTVNFHTQINVQPGAQKYVLHDSMSAGLTFQEVTKIEHVIPGTDTHEVPAEKYTVVTDPEDGCTFDVVFTDEFIAEMQPNDKVIVYYSAMLNRNAIVAGDGNSNEAWLDFAEGSHTTHSSTQTYTFGFDIVKTDSQNKLIDGAKFKIYDAETGGNEVPVVLNDDGETYRRARADETGVEIEVKGGMVRVNGFDNGTYYLEEIEAPEGYNKINVRQKFIIANGNIDAVFNGEIFSTGSGVHVVNKTGTILPETGGIGTTMFYALGGLLIAGALVLLITRKRMSEN